MLLLSETLELQQHHPLGSVLQTAVLLPGWWAAPAGATAAVEAPVAGMAHPHLQCQQQRGLVAVYELEQGFQRVLAASGE